MIGPVPRLTSALALLLSFVLVGCNGSEETNGKSSEGNGDDGGAGAAPGSPPTDG